MSAGDDQGERKRLENEVAPFRQPMVTSLGIILGFLLAFLANWAAHDESANEPAVSTDSDWLIFATLLQPSEQQWYFMPLYSLSR